eukprot:g75431.t1
MIVAYRWHKTNSEVVYYNFKQNEIERLHRLKAPDEGSPILPAQAKHGVLRSNAKLFGMIGLATLSAACLGDSMGVLDANAETLCGKSLESAKKHGLKEKLTKTKQKGKCKKAKKSEIDKIPSECGNCYCIVGEDGCCPKPNYIPTNSDIQAWSQQKALNPYQLTCNPFTTPTCTTTPPQTELKNPDAACGILYHTSLIILCTCVLG